jgi:hypothetical protein
MPLIQATTPTSAGFAQAFDTSGIVAYNEQRREERKKKMDKAIQDSIIDYDTKGAWKRDIPEIQRQINEVNSFASNNIEALMNPSQNIETYQQFKELQNRIKNTITYSIAAKEQNDKATSQFLRGDGRYATDRNKEILYQYQQAPSREQYENMTAFDNPMNYFDRNVPQGLMDAEIKVAQGLVYDVPPDVGGELVDGVHLVTKGKALDRAKVEETMLPRFRAQTPEGGDLRYLYGEGVEAEQKYIDDVIKGVSTSPEYSTVRTSTAAEKKATARDLGREAAVQFTDKSRQSYYESQFEYVPGKKRNDPEALMPISYTTEDGKNTPSLSRYGIGTSGSQVMVFKPMKIMKNVGQAYDATTGEMVTEGGGKRYKYQYPVERAKYITSNGNFELRFVNDEGKKIVHKFSKGEAVPNLKEMLNDGKITQNEYDRVIGYLGEEEGYMVYASNENIDYQDLASSEKIENMLKTGGMRLLMVPLESLDFEVDQALMDEYGVDQKWYMDQQGYAPDSDDNYLDF